MRRLIATVALALGIAAGAAPAVAAPGMWCRSDQKKDPITGLCVPKATGAPTSVHAGGPPTCPAHRVWNPVKKLCLPPPAASRAG